MKRLKIWKGIKMPLFANKQIKNEFGNTAGCTLHK